jgi:F-type H+-transporting ATPase subunit delta
MARRDSAARRYAEAAFEIATRDDTVDTWRADLEMAAQIVSDERVERVLSNPAVAAAERATVVDRALGKAISRPVLNLIHLQLRRGRIEQLPQVAAEFRRLDNQRKGITEASATAAAELTPSEVKALTKRLEQLTGGRVELDVQVDPSLLGGLVVRVGDRLIDGSVRGRLERLRNRLVAGTL